MFHVLRGETLLEDTEVDTGIESGDFDPGLGDTAPPDLEVEEPSA